MKAQILRDVREDVFTEGRWISYTSAASSPGDLIDWMSDEGIEMRAYASAEEVKRDILLLKGSGILADSFLHALRFRGEYDGIDAWMQAEGIELDVPASGLLR